MIEHIPEIVDSGIVSFKVEGRMKSSYYVATVMKAYRQAIDSYLREGENYKFKQEWAEDLAKASHREYSTGFYFGKPEKQILGNSTYIRTHDIVGIVVDYDAESKTATIEQRNRVFKDETVEILSPDTKSFNITLSEMWDTEGMEITSAPHPQMIYKIKCEHILRPFDMLVKEKGE